MFVVKSITQRLWPTDVAASGNDSDTFFQGSKSPRSARAPAFR